MGMEKIRETVLGTASAEAARIVSAAEKHWREWLAEQKAQVRDQAEQRYQAGVRAIEDEMARQLIQFKGTASRQLLDKKNKWLRHIFDRARQEVLNWPPSSYAALIRRLLEPVAATRSGQVRFHPEERETVSKVLAELNGGRAAATRLAPDEAHPLQERGGIVFVTPEYEVDLTLRKLLEDMEHELTPAIAAELFSS